MNGLADEERPRTGDSYVAYMSLVSAGWLRQHWAAPEPARLGFVRVALLLLGKHFQARPGTSQTSL